MLPSGTLNTPLISSSPATRNSAGVNDASANTHVKPNTKNNFLNILHYTPFIYIIYLTLYTKIRKWKMRINKG